AHGRAPGVHRRDEADDGADQHHPFEPEIHDARAFAEQLGERRIEERRPREDRSQHEASEQPLHQPFSMVACAAGGPSPRPPLGSFCRRPRRTKSITAIRMFTTEAGIAWVICKMSPPALM